MDLDQKTLDRARLAMRIAVRDWIYDPNVTFIDFGWPEHGGALYDNELSIRIHLAEKIPKGPQLEAAIEQGITHRAIPDEIGGIRVDRPQATFRVRQWFGGGWGRPTNPRSQRSSPMRGGISVSNAYQNTYGTLGGLVKDRDTGREMILSNWHVLAGDWGALSGWPIRQPGRLDRGSHADTVATLTRHAMSSGLDAAVAELNGSRQLINDQYELGPVRGVGRSQQGMNVIKSGRQTGVTFGRITTGLPGTYPMRYFGVTRLIHNVTRVDLRRGIQVSDGGDSGSLWLEEESRDAIGLHFAGSNFPEYALAIDLQPILDALNVDLVFGP